MRAYGSHRQPAGTWSDDASLTFCLAESIAHAGHLDPRDLAQRFIRWREEAYWSARDEVFDIGIGTSRAIDRMMIGEAPTSCGGRDEMSNGNGSLMRILPLLALTMGLPSTEVYNLAADCSALTHGHPRSHLACTYYLLFAEQITHGVLPARA